MLPSLLLRLGLATFIHVPKAVLSTILSIAVGLANTSLLTRANPGPRLEELAHWLRGFSTEYFVFNGDARVNVHVLDVLSGLSRFRDYDFVPPLNHFTHLYPRSEISQLTFNTPPTVSGTSVRNTMVSPQVSYMKNFRRI